MTEEHIALNDESFACLLQKFVEEIADLRAAASQEDENSELQLQLREAVGQSEELYDELKSVHSMYLAAQAAGRPFSPEEQSALRYFGFAIPAGACAPQRQGAIQLPPRRALSETREMSVENETETDVFDTITNARAFLRERTPEGAANIFETDSASRDQPLSPSPGVQKMSTSRLLPAPLTPSPRGNISDLHLGRKEQERRELMLRQEEKLVALQREVLDMKLMLVETKETHLRETELREKAHRTEIDSERNRHAQERLVLEEQLSSFRERMASESDKRIAIESELTKLRQTFESELGALQQQRAESDVQSRQLVLQLRDALRDATLEHRRITEVATEAVQSLAPKVANSTPAELPHTAASEAASAAVSLYFRLRSSSSQTVAYSLGSCPDADVLDEAVANVLTELRFPFVVGIRRLGKGGDYFIDRRVQIRVVNGTVVVRPRQPPQHSSAPSQYELLSHYLVHLYSPLLPLDSDAYGSPPKPVARVVDNDDRLAELLRERDRLQHSVRMQQEIVERQQQVVRRQISPSPQSEARAPDSFEAQRKSQGWRRPPSPSPAMDTVYELRPSHTRPSGTQASELQSRSASALSQKSQKKVTMDFSQLSSEELEQLKRAALAQQVREMRRMSSASRGGKT